MGSRGDAAIATRSIQAMTTAVLGATSNRPRPAADALHTRTYEYVGGLRWHCVLVSRSCDTTCDARHGKCQNVCSCIGLQRTPKAVAPSACDAHALGHSRHSVTRPNPGRSAGLHTLRRRTPTLDLLATPGRQHPVFGSALRVPGSRRGPPGADPWL